eukprot:326675-Chlamydomonas_euryale.AAC.7
MLQPCAVPAAMLRLRSSHRHHAPLRRAEAAGRAFFLRNHPDTPANCAARFRTAADKICSFVCDHARGTTRSGGVGRASNDADSGTGLGTPVSSCRPHNTGSDSGTSDLAPRGGTDAWRSGPGSARRAPIPTFTAGDARCWNLSLSSC